MRRLAVVTLVAIGLALAGPSAERAEAGMYWVNVCTDSDQRNNAFVAATQNSGVATPSGMGACHAASGLVTRANDHYLDAASYEFCPPTGTLVNSWNVTLRSSWF